MSASTPDQIALLRQALGAYRSALRSGESESQQMIDLADTALKPMRVEEPAGEPVGDETEALRARVKTRHSELLKTMPYKQAEAQAWQETACAVAARVAGLEATEAALRDALTVIRDLPTRHDLLLNAEAL